MEGERVRVCQILPRSTRPIICTHSRGTLRVISVFGSASLSYCQAENIWGASSCGFTRLNPTAVIVYLLLHTPQCFFLGLFLEYSLLSLLSVITLYRNLEQCVFISLLTFKYVKISLLSVRGEFKFPRAAAAVALCVSLQIYNKRNQVQRSRKQ